MPKQGANDLMTRRKRVNEILKKQGIGMEAVRRSYLKQLKYTNPVAFKDLAEQKFVELVRRLCEANGFEGVNRLTIEREAAGELEISLPTARRYLEAHSYSRGEFFIFGKNVLLNQDYRPPEEEVEGEDEDPD